MIEGNMWEILLDSWILFGTCKLYTWEVGVLGCFILKTICEVSSDFKGASIRGISAEHGIGQCKPHYLHLSKAESAMNLMKMLGYAFVMCNQKTGFQNFVRKWSWLGNMPLQSKICCTGNIGTLWSRRSDGHQLVLIFHDYSGIPSW